MIQDGGGTGDVPSGRTYCSCLFTVIALSESVTFLYMHHSNRPREKRITYQVLILCCEHY